MAEASNDKPEYVSCVGCHKPLFYSEIELSIGITAELPHCSNEECPRYGLYTAVVDA